jgi:hypothetical protein
MIRSTWPAGSIIPASQPDANVRVSMEGLMGSILTDGRICWLTPAAHGGEHPGMVFIDHQPEAVAGQIVRINFPGRMTFNASWSGNWCVPTHMPTWAYPQIKLPAIKSMFLVGSFWSLPIYDWSIYHSSIRSGVFPGPAFFSLLPGRYAVLNFKFAGSLFESLKGWKNKR